MTPIVYLKNFWVLKQGLECMLHLYFKFKFMVFVLPIDTSILRVISLYIP